MRVDQILTNKYNTEVDVRGIVKHTQREKIMKGEI